jgi:preprotein translocase subunit SecG
MFGFILTVLILDALLLSVVVLLQAGQGGGLASLGGGGGTESFVGGRQAVTILTRATWWLGGVFLFLSLILSVFSARQSTTASDVQQLLQQPTQAPAPSSALPLGGQEATPTSTPATAAPAPATGTTTTPQPKPQP